MSGLCAEAMTFKIYTVQENLCSVRAYV